jgi:Protein of unknown function (DUF2510)
MRRELANIYNRKAGSKHPWNWVGGQVSQDDLFGAPAGWYPDPLGLPQLRWWNNHAWTEQTSAARQPMVMQDTKFAWADDELPTRREERERERTRDESEGLNNSRPTADVLRELNPPQAFAKPNDIPAAPAAQPSVVEQAQQSEKTFNAPPIYPSPPSSEEPTTNSEHVETSQVGTSGVGISPVGTGQPLDPGQTVGFTSAVATHDELLDELFGTRRERQVTPTMSVPIVQTEPVVPATKVGTAIVSTGPAWIIAMIPLFQLVFSLLLLNFGLGGIPSLFIGILTVPYLLVIILAILDRQMLKRGGNTRPAHWAWAALTAPVYLLMRARAVISQSGKGIGPVLVWFALAFLHVASVVAIPGLLISVLPNLFVPQIEQSVAQDALLKNGTELTVTCPSTPPVLIGEQFVCKSVNSNGTEASVTVSLVRSNGWIAWQVLDWGVNSLSRN